MKRGREVEFSVEREVFDAAGVPRRLRVASRYVIDEGAGAPTAADLASAVTQLDRELEGAVAQAGFRGSSARADRGRTELLETYRPRRSQLIDALLADGEVTEGEAKILREALPARAPALPTRDLAPDRALVPETDRPLAAMPLSVDRAPSSPRPVPELLATFQIATLKQAGAIRARRQISYDEYMALKRHFGGGASAPASTA